MRTRTGTALLVALTGCSGCTISTSTVRVHDPAQVAIESKDGAPLMAMGATEARLANGTFWEPFHEVPYEIRGERGPDGTLALRCEACALASLPVLDAGGQTRPAWSWRVAIEPSRVTVSYEDECLRDSGRFCDVKPPVRLVIPRDDVVEVRRRVEPVRILGYLYAGMGALALGTLTVVAIKDHDAAPFAAVASIPFLAFGGFGLWEILAPAREEVWTPTPGSGERRGEVR